MSGLRLTFAASEYEHTRDLTSGAVRAEGIDLTYLPLTVEETFFRFLNYQEWDVSELSFGKYVSLASQDDPRFVAIPVFPSRVFRQSSLYVRRDSPLKRPEDLRGKRVGVPEWAQTAAIYTRGWLHHDVGIPLSEIRWVQAGVNEAGREEKVALRLPEGVSLEPRTDRSLTELLLAGEIDAIASAHPPAPVEAGGSEIVHLIADYRAVEEAYFRATGIFPIMHVVAIRRPVWEANKWIAFSLFRGFEEAKRRSQARMVEVTASRVPFAWGFEAAEKARALFGEDFFPYGIEPNRKTLEAFLRYAHEQGVCHRLLSPEDLFVPGFEKTHRV